MQDRELKIDKGGTGLKIWPDPSPNGLSHAIFFVHGYNVAPEDAKRSFERLLANLRFVDRVPPGLASRSWRVNWEGYARSLLDSLSKGAFSFMTYPTQIGVAERSAAAFADYLRSLRGPRGTTMEVSFVGHSLGCRLVLEVLRSLNAQPGPKVRLIFLIAAAVPVHMVYPNRSLHSAAMLPL
jgi:pimeloyl-ACP methyl ester carboxylesterase